MDTLNTFGWLPLCVVVCGLVAGWLFFQNTIKKDDPGKDVIRTLAGALLCFAPFVWRQMSGGTSMEYSLLLLCFTGGFSFLIFQGLLTQSKHVGKDRDHGLMPVSVLSLVMCSFLVLGYGFLSWYDQHQIARASSVGKSAPPTPFKK